MSTMVLLLRKCLMHKAIIMWHRGINTTMLVSEYIHMYDCHSK